MKKIAFGLLVLLSNLSLGQEKQDVKNDSKFQVGIHYVGNLRNENIISDGFNGVVGISGNYAVYQDETISVFGGLTIDYLQTRDYFLQNDILIWNPNASIEIDAFKGKLKPYFGLGYAFFSNEFKYETSSFDPSDPAFITRTTRFNFNGLTINPGLKYHVSDLLFIEGSYKYFPINSDDISGTANTHFINIGVGFKF
jgi:opacity protein-like surface antigen